MCRDVVAKKERLGTERGVQKNALRLGEGNEVLFRFLIFNIYRKRHHLTRFVGRCVDEGRESCACLNEGRRSCNKNKKNA